MVLSEGYTGGATFPGAAYRAVKVIKDIEIRDLTFKNSTGTAIDFDDCRNIFMEDMELLDNNKGFVMDNCAEIAIDNIIIPSSTDNGCEFNTCGFGDIEGLSTPSNGGHGVVMNNVRIMPFNNCASNSNTGDGYNITTGDTVQLVVEASSNSGQGIEFVSGNVGCFVHNSIVESNTSDGIKLTASSDDILISNNQINSNGGYGVNIAVSGDDNNIVVGNKFASNTSGAINDSGTGTTRGSNSGDAIVSFRGTSTQAAELRLYEDTDDGVNYTSFKAGTQSANIDYTLPTDDGNADEFLKTNGSGVLSWAVASGSGSERINTTTTNVNVSNTTDETNLISFTLNANKLSTANILWVRIYFDSFNCQGAGGINLKCYYDTASIDLINGSSVGTYASSLGWVDFFIYASGATNTQELCGQINMSVSATVPSAALTQLYNVVVGTGAIDSTVNKTVKITFKAAIADANTNINMVNGFAVLLK